MYNASMKQEVVKKKGGYPTELTEMQRRFCEYLVMNEGRTTGKDAAIAAGYVAKTARQEAYRLQQNPQIQMYLTKRMNEVNKALWLIDTTILKDKSTYPKCWKMDTHTQPKLHPLNLT